MRAFLVIALTLGLCACSNWDGSFFGDSDAAHEATPAPAPMAEAPMAPAPAPVTTAQAQETPPAAPMSAAPVMSAPPQASGDRCAKLARQRAGDAAYQGEDEGTQRSVYDRTYSGCMDWDARHAL
jgi:hypothetical protein